MFHYDDQENFIISRATSKKMFTRLEYTYTYIIAQLDDKFVLEIPSMNFMSSMFKCELKIHDFFYPIH